MLRERRRHANFKPNRRLDRKSSRGMIYENEELRLRTININAEVERGQSDIRKLRRENDQLRKEIWSLRDEYDRLDKLLRANRDGSRNDSDDGGGGGGASGYGDLDDYDDNDDLDMDEDGMKCDSCNQSEDSNSCDSCNNLENTYGSYSSSGEPVPTTVHGGTGSNSNSSISGGAGTNSMNRSQTDIYEMNENKQLNGGQNQFLSPSIIKGTAQHQQQQQQQQSQNHQQHQQQQQLQQQVNKEKLHVNFDHLSIVSEENLTLSDANSVNQLSIENLNIITGGSDDDFQPEKSSALTDFQSIVPPLTHFENLDYDKIGPNLDSYGEVCYSESTTTTTSGETVIAASEWDFSKRKIYDNKLEQSTKIYSYHSEQLNKPTTAMTTTTTTTMTTVTSATSTTTPATSSKTPLPYENSNIDNRLTSSHSLPFNISTTIGQSNQQQQQSVATTQGTPTIPTTRPKHFFSPIKSKLYLNTNLAPSPPAPLPPAPVLLLQNVIGHESEFNQFDDSTAAAGAAAAASIGGQITSGPDFCVSNGLATPYRMGQGQGQHGTMTTANQRYPLQTQQSLPEQFLIAPNSFGQTNAGVIATDCYGYGGIGMATGGYGTGSCTGGTIPIEPIYAQIQKSIKTTTTTTTNPTPNQMQVLCTSPSIFQHGGNLDELLQDIELLSNDMETIRIVADDDHHHHHQFIPIVSASVEVAGGGITSPATSTETMAIASDHQNPIINSNLKSMSSKPFRSEMNLTLCYDDGSTIPTIKSSTTTTTAQLAHGETDDDPDPDDDDDDDDEESPPPNVPQPMLLLPKTLPYIGLEEFNLPFIDEQQKQKRKLMGNSSVTAVDDHDDDDELLPLNELTLNESQTFLKKFQTQIPTISSENPIPSPPPPPPTASPPPPPSSSSASHVPISIIPTSTTTATVVSSTTTTTTTTNTITSNLKMGKQHSDGTTKSLKTSTGATIPLTTSLQNVRRRFFSRNKTIPNDDDDDDEKGMKTATATVTGNANCNQSIEEYSDGFQESTINNDGLKKSSSFNSKKLTGISSSSSTGGGIDQIGTGGGGGGGVGGGGGGGGSSTSTSTSQSGSGISIINVPMNAATNVELNELNTNGKRKSRRVSIYFNGKKDEKPETKKESTGNGKKQLEHSSSFNRLRRNSSVTDVTTATSSSQQQQQQQPGNNSTTTTATVTTATTKRHHHNHHHHHGQGQGQGQGQNSGNNHTGHHHHHHHNHNHNHGHNLHNGNRKMSQDSIRSSRLKKSTSISLLRRRSDSIGTLNSQYDYAGGLIMDQHGGGGGGSVNGSGQTIIGGQSSTMAAGGSGPGSGLVPSLSERNSNSIASSRESSTSLSTRSQKSRKISISSHGGGKIPWCGCWGNGCL